MAGRLPAALKPLVSFLPLPRDRCATVARHAAPTPDQPPSLLLPRSPRQSSPSLAPPAVLPPVPDPLTSASAATSSTAFASNVAAGKTPLPISHWSPPLPESSASKVASPHPACSHHRSIPPPGRGIATPAFAAVGKYHAGTSATQDVFTGRVQLTGHRKNRPSPFRPLSTARQPQFEKIHRNSNACQPAGA